MTDEQKTDCLTKVLLAAILWFAAVGFAFVLGSLITLVWNIVS